ncbi:MAG: asparaginase [Candidatus Gastranaerophilales bacterium]|nr:asparaginase [Candidatus Gastranaerophilales bacterium]
MEPEYKKLIEFQRNAIVEQEHSGLILLLDKKKVLKRIGSDNGAKFYLRSCMKPLQFALHIDEDVPKTFSFTREEIAVCCASHTGSLKHQKVVRNILNKIGLDESYLLCPAHLPLSLIEQTRLIKENILFKPIHNNCSGKHSAMLALCQKMGWNKSNYMDKNHPLYWSIINRVLSLCEVQNDDFVISKDGCGLATVATTLSQLGKGFLNLFLDDKYVAVKDAFLNEPFLIGGENRLDSSIIEASEGTLIAKVGAGGLIVVVNPNLGQAIVVKIADANMQARAIATTEALLQLGWLTREQVETSSLKSQNDRHVTTLLGEQIGQIIPTFQF